MACECHTSENINLQLKAVTQHNKDTYSFDFISEDPVFWKEGDSSKVILDIDGYKEGRKLSLVTLPFEDTIRYTTRIRKNPSLFKEFLGKLQVGDKVESTYPSGEFYLRRDGRPALLLSNGVGLATMRSLIKAFNNDSTHVNKMTQINVDNSGRLYQDEMEGLAKDNLFFSSIYTANREEFYDVLDYESQKLMFQTGIIPNVYVVGSDRFVIDVSSYLMSVGYDQNQIITDGFYSLGASCGSGCGCSSGGCGSGCGC